MRIGYLGPKGTFSHKAAKLCFPVCNLKEFKTITELILALEQKEIEQTVVPVENSIQGGVTETIDCLMKTNEIFVIREIIIEIKQTLLANKSYALDELKVIYSHPQAIAQCRDFIIKNLKGAEIINMPSTALAAHEIGHRDFCACIASVDCAHEYNLVVLCDNIQDNSFNKTRFWVLSRQKNLNGDKMSIVLWLENKVGALCCVLKIFSDYNINLLRIESRPATTQLGIYVFLLDFEVGDLAEKCLNSLKSKCKKIKILGRYLKEN